MNIRRLVRKIKYLLSDKKDIIYPDKLNRYLTEDMFNSDIIITVIKYIPKRDTYTIFIRPTKLNKGENYEH